MFSPVEVILLLQLGLSLQRFRFLPLAIVVSLTLGYVATWSVSHEANLGPATGYAYWANSAGLSPLETQLAGLIAALT